MNIFHGTWISENTNSFDNEGSLMLWVETEIWSPAGNHGALHPGCLNKEGLLWLFREILCVKKELLDWIDQTAKTGFILLPASDNRPLPSLDLVELSALPMPEPQSWMWFEVWGIFPEDMLDLLREIHFLSWYSPHDVRLGEDFRYWHHLSQQLQTLLNKDQYIPSIRIFEEPKNASKKIMGFSPGWDLLTPDFEELLVQLSSCMPPVCRAGNQNPHSAHNLSEAKAVVSQFFEIGLDQTIRQLKFPQKIHQMTDGTFLEKCLPSNTVTHVNDPYARKNNLTVYAGEQWKEWHRQWFTWKKQLFSIQTNPLFVLCFRLHSAKDEDPDQWELEFLVESRKDPSLKVPLAEYWKFENKAQGEFKKYFGQHFEKDILLQLGSASRIYPKLWDGLQNGLPGNMMLTLEETFSFLKETSKVLEESGYKVIIPTWWTPEGKKRAKLRLKAKSVVPQKQEMASGYFNLHSLARYKYQLSIGGEVVSPDEWEALVQAKTPLVRFRGEWIELDRNLMQEMLDLWNNNGNEEASISLMDLLKRSVVEEDQLEIELDQDLEHLMRGLSNKSGMQLMETPAGLKGELREYQKRGLSWLNYLETLNMGACLADDMGLGKTIQIIALLLHERETGRVRPTLLIAPTSVLGNWKKEMERFAPSLRIMVHHGIQRVQDKDVFEQKCQQVDAVITSFTLSRKDLQLLETIQWHRIVIDEAQNIKNPQSQQAKSILKLQAPRRTALTGTPIENRLLDIWAIFHFLNPGYLGNQNQFKINFEVPIQKNDDKAQLKLFKKLVEPFILRRLKTDKSIIKDLPDKVEQKIFCTLSKEQASLYQNVVDEVQEALDDTEGIQRKGLILSTLIKLKQICNHPAQFLKDGSEFAPDRSRKLERLTEMVHEILDNEESMLLFTQFTEIGAQLEQLLKDHHIPTWYLHGQVSRERRESMIAEFQESGLPGVFILSLRAGGVGITLTRANHVFHFDRWWNPAVENQATDRAFRIGQTRKVMVHKFITVGTLEERIDKLLEDKKHLSDSIVGSDESWLTELDNESFRRLIRLSKDAMME
ncbi:MAG: DEAD/DEAH box helicase [SAR324 cluster bacterium]|nr:DEAD/DEAH box helicase [SAR324 cluster bacterium]